MLFLSPTGASLVFVSIGVFTRKYAPTVSGFMYALSILTLVCFSLPAVANRLYQSIEAIHPAVPIEFVESASYIVVLGGSMEPPVYPRVIAELGESGDRVIHAWRLYQAGKAPVVIVSGGQIYAGSDVLPESVYMRDMLVELGVPEAHIIVESDSRTTYENAVNTFQILAALSDSDEGATSGPEATPSVLLVTSALHMGRALAAFRKAGVYVTAATTDIRQANNGAPGWLRWFPDARALSRSTEVIREWLATMVYRALGRA